MKYITYFYKFGDLFQLKNFLFLLSALIIALCIVSCGGDGGIETFDGDSTSSASTDEAETALSTEKRLVGTWYTDIDYAQTLNSYLFESDEQNKDYRFESVPVTYVFTFLDDGTASIHAEDGAYDKYIKNVKSALSGYLSDYVAKLTGNIPEMREDDILSLFEDIYTELNGGDVFLDFDGTYETTTGRLYFLYPDETKVESDAVIYYFDGENLILESQTESIFSPLCLRKTK